MKSSGSRRHEVNEAGEVDVAVAAVEATSQDECQAGEPGEASGLRHPPRETYHADRFGSLPMEEPGLRHLPLDHILDQAHQQCEHLGEGVPDQASYPTAPELVKCQPDKQVYGR